MKNSYKISGMTCNGCTEIVHNNISKITGVKSVVVDLNKAQTNIEMEYHISIEVLQAALADTLYQISELDVPPTETQNLKLYDEVSKKNKELIAVYLKAVSQLDYASLKEYLHPDFKYNGELNFENSNEYVSLIKDHANSPVAEVILEYEIKAIFADENMCCAIYDSVSRFPGKKVSFAEWIKIKDGKIISTNVKFNRHQMKQLIQEMGNTKN